MSVDVLVKPTADARTRAEASRAERRTLERRYERAWQAWIETLPDEVRVHVVADDRRPA